MSAGRSAQAEIARCVALDRFSLLSGTGPLVVIFSLKLKETLPNFRPPWRNKGVEAESILKYISQNKPLKKLGLNLSHFITPGGSGTLQVYPENPLFFKKKRRVEALNPENPFGLRL